MPTPSPCGCKRQHPAAVAVHWAVGVHRAVAQRRAELPLCRAEVAGSHGQQIARSTALAQSSAQRKALGHGAAGPEQPGKGHAQLPHGIAGCRALGLQIPGKGQLHLFLRKRRLLQAQPRGAQLQVFFRSFPAGLAKAVVCAQLVELCRQRAALFLQPTAAPAAITGSVWNSRVSPHRTVIGKISPSWKIDEKRSIKCCIITSCCNLTAHLPVFMTAQAHPPCPAPTAPRRTPPPPACRTRSPARQW